MKNNALSIRLWIREAARLPPRLLSVTARATRSVPSSSGMNKESAALQRISAYLVRPPIQPRCSSSKTAARMRTASPVENSRSIDSNDCGVARNRSIASRIEVFTSPRAMTSMGSIVCQFPIQTRAAARSATSMCRTANVSGSKSGRFRRHSVAGVGCDSMTRHSRPPQLTQKSTTQRCPSTTMKPGRSQNVRVTGSDSIINQASSAPRLYSVNRRPSFGLKTSYRCAP